MRKITKIISLTIALTAIFLPNVSDAREIIYDAPEEILVAQYTPTSTATQNDVEKPSSDSPEAPAPKITLDQAKQRFLDLKEEIDNGTKNLDIYFEYAQIAATIGNAKEAEFAYKHMLETDHQLYRVKLELALLYVRMGKLKDSKKLFEEVLSTNPPEAVQKNIENVMIVVNNGLKPDVFSGSVSTGYNMDSNANSAASSGQTTFVDTSIPLSDSSVASRDGHAYASASLNHVHKFDTDSDYYQLSMETTGTLYKTYQDTESTLNLGLASIKTGPAIELPTLRTKLGISGTESIIDLNGNRYLKTRSWETNINYAMLDNLLLNSSYSYEYRKFINTPLATTYTDRSGNANQQSLGVTYAFTPSNIFNTTATWRHENAFNQIFGNTQVSITGSYIRQLPWDLMFNALLGLKKTNYHQPDPIVSAANLRHDRERSMTYTLAKRLPHNLTATTAYQYKNVSSNVQNNDYSNNRYSLGLGWAF